MILYLNIIVLKKEIDKLKEKKLVRIHHILLYLLKIKRALEETNDSDILEALKEVEKLLRDNYDLLIEYFRVFAEEYFYEKSREMFLKDMFITLYHLSGDGRFLKPFF
jgi:signal-transduction protein with cAMP-binding, CBS, and nucleotidyltransferase domain